MGGKGNIVHFAGFLVDPEHAACASRRSRRRSTRPTARVKLVQTIADIDAPRAGRPEDQRASWPRRASEIDGIVATAWIPSVVAANVAAQRSATSASRWSASTMTRSC